MANNKIGWVISSAPCDSNASRFVKLPHWKIITSNPNVADTVNVFINTALIGNTTDPVIKKSRISVLPTRMAIAHGMRLASVAR